MKKFFFISSESAPTCHGSPTLFETQVYIKKIWQRWEAKMHLPTDMPGNLLGQKSLSLTQLASSLCSSPSSVSPAMGKACTSPVSGSISSSLPFMLPRKKAGAVNSETGIRSLDIIKRDGWLGWHSACLSCEQDLWVRIQTFLKNHKWAT